MSQEMLGECNKFERNLLETQEVVEIKGKVSIMVA